MLYICNGNGDMFGGDLHGLVWKYISGVMYPWNVFGEYGEYVDGVDENYFLQGTYSGYYIDGNAQW